MASLDPYQGILGTQSALHLLRRATFGYTKPMADQFAAFTVQQAVSKLLASVPTPKDTELAWLIPHPLEAEEVDEELKIKNFQTWYLSRMHTTPASSLEKLTFFLHTHFTTIKSKVEKHTALYYQNKLLRQFALGNLRTLAKKICLDNAMLRLLDGQLNVKGSPNENFAREFFELYSIGKGAEKGPGDYTTYTEQDIREAAKIVSGFEAELTYYTLDADTGIPCGKATTDKMQGNSPVATKHDASLKTFSAFYQNTAVGPHTKIGEQATVAAAMDEIDQLVRMIFSKKETALNFCRKLYRFFVYYNITPQVEINVIMPLAELLYANDYEIKPVIEKLLQSQHFFDTDNTSTTDDARGALIKSPLELVLGTMVFFEAAPNPKPPENADEKYAGPYEDLLKVLETQGMEFYEPLDVAGYDAYSQYPYYQRNWISANYLANRYLFPFKLVNALKGGSNYFSFSIDVVSYVQNPSNISDPGNATTLVQELIKYLLPEPITDLRFSYFKNLFLDNFGNQQWQTEWAKFVATGNDATVKQQLETLIIAIVKSPEYQLS